MKARKLKRPNVGECQKLFDKYGIEDTIHNGTTTDLCAVILELESRLEEWRSMGVNEIAEYMKGI